MQFTTLASFLALAASTLAQSSGTGTAAYDPAFDTADLSTLNVACSDGANGLYTKGYKTLGALPGFPNIGGSSEVAAWNSTNCGGCYSVTYQNISVFITAVDHASGGWVLSQTTLDKMTGGQAVTLGRVPVTWVPAPAASCGF